MLARFYPARLAIVVSRILSCWAVLFLAGTAARAQDNTLTNAAAIRQLSAADASIPLPVRLRGVVVTEAGPSADRALVLADDTAGIYVFGPTNAFAETRRGDLLEIEGVTDPGEFAPILLARTVHKIGTGPLPKPANVTYAQLIAGTYDGQLVEISGVVRSWEPITAPNEFGKWHMEMVVGNGRLTVSCNGEHPPEVERDAEVRIQGVCFYQFNNKRQVLSPTVLISRYSTVQIEKPAPLDPFAAPTRSVASLLQFSPHADYRHRVHVRGTVTYQQPGVAVWIRDPSSGLRVQTRQRGLLKPGDEIDVVGYPRYGAEAPVLEDAIYQVRKSGPAPVPVTLPTPAHAFDHEEDLVTVDALLTEVQPILDGVAFTFQENGATFKAMLRRALAQNAVRVWKPGSRIRITGICSVVSDDSRPVISGVWRPRSFQILLRNTSDLAIITPPPWWTPEHVILLLGIGVAISLIATASVMLVARRHLREQAARRAMAEAEFAAILSERNRLAREIHDTLAQGLAATSIQIRLAKKNASGDVAALTHHLDTAQDLVRGSLAEARNSIWNMRSHVLESSDLAGALNEVLKQLCEGTGVETSLDTVGRTRRLAPVIENNLLRVGQEAISNALKHSHATRISVTLEFSEKQFRLIIRDNGRGFNVEKPGSSDGGFGLVGMRERAAELKGELTVRSDEHGTEIVLAVPVSGE